MTLEEKEATYVKNIEFWCSDCDANKVHSDKPETGKFFCQFGHVWVPKKGEVQGYVADEYTQVIFALCPLCIKDRKKY